MAGVIRAVYEHGQLRPLHPLALADGQEVDLAILSPLEQARMLLADLLVPTAAEPLPELDEAALVAEIDAALSGTPPVSEAILDERGKGP